MTAETESKRSQNKTKTKYCQKNRVTTSTFKMCSSISYPCELQTKFKGSGCKEMSISLHKETKIQTYQIIVIFPAPQDASSS